MSRWSELRDTVGLPRGRAPWATLVTVMTLLVAGWLLQERISRPDPSYVDYSDFRRLVQQGQVELVVIQGQELDGDFSATQTVAGHETRMFRTFVPANDPSLWPLLNDKNVRVRVIPAGPGLLTRLVFGALPLVSFLALGLWFSRHPSSGTRGERLTQGS